MKHLLTQQIKAPITTAVNLAHANAVHAESEKEEWDIRELERRDFHLQLSALRGEVGETLARELANYLVIHKGVNAKEARAEVLEQWPELLPEILKAQPLTLEQAKSLGVLRASDLGVDEWTKIERKEHKPEFDPGHGQRSSRLTALCKAIEKSVHAKTPGEVVEILKTVLPPGYRIHSKPPHALGRVLNAIRVLLEGVGKNYWSNPEANFLAENIQGALLRGVRGDNECAIAEVIPNVWVAFTGITTGSLGRKMLETFGKWRTACNFADLIACVPDLEQACADWIKVQHPVRMCMRAALHGNLSAYLAPNAVSWMTRAERKEVFEGGPAKVILQQGMPGDEIMTALEIIGAMPFAQAVDQVMKGNAAVDGRFLSINMDAPVESIIKRLDEHIPTSMNTVRHRAQDQLAKGLSTSAFVPGELATIRKDMPPKEVSDLVRAVHPNLVVVAIEEYGKPSVFDGFLIVDKSLSGDEIIKQVRENCPRADAYLTEIRFLHGAQVPNGLVFVTTDHPVNVAGRFKDEFPEAARIIVAQWRAENNICPLDLTVRLQDHIRELITGRQLYERISCESARACAEILINHANNNGGRLRLVSGDDEWGPERTAAIVAEEQESIPIKRAELRLLAAKDEIAILKELTEQQAARIRQLQIEAGLVESKSETVILREALEPGRKIHIKAEGKIEPTVPVLSAGTIVIEAGEHRIKVPAAPCSFTLNWDGKELVIQELSATGWPLAKGYPARPTDFAVDGARDNLALIRGVAFLIWELEGRLRKLEEVGAGLLSGMMIHELDLMIEHLMALYPKKMAMLIKERAGENTQAPGCPDQLVEELSDHLGMRLALTCLEAIDLACWAFEIGAKATRDLNSLPQPKSDAPPINLTPETGAVPTHVVPMREIELAHERGTKEIVDICAAVDEFAKAMRNKMVLKFLEGYSGWNELENYDRIKTMLADHLAKGDMVDVANFAMMVRLLGRKAAEGGKRKKL